MSNPIEKDHVVSIHYTLKDDDGVVIDSSEGQEPLVYLHGAGNIIPGLEAALTGKVLGDALNVSIAPADAYGEKEDELIQVVPRHLFQGADELEAGMQFQAQAPNGGVQVIQVLDVQDEDVTIDANHPLAGKTLHFSVAVEAVRDATAEELEHGHVHSGSCSH